MWFWFHFLIISAHLILSWVFTCDQAPAALLVALVVKKPTGQYRRHKRREFDPWVGNSWTWLKQISMPPYQGQIAPWKGLLLSLLEQSKRYGYDVSVAVRKEKYVCLREIWNFEGEEFGNKLDLAIIEERRGTVEPSSWCLNSFEF